MKKIFVSMLLCSILLWNHVGTAQAAVSQSVEITAEHPEEFYLNQSYIDDTIYEFPMPDLLYDHVSVVGIGFGIFGNEAECALSVDGYSEVSKISVYIYLQRYVLGKWTTIPGGTFRKEVNSSSMDFIPTKKLDTIGSYRFKTDIFVYTKDGSTELIEDVSNVAVY